jgi:hypothetical protein
MTQRMIRISCPNFVVLTEEVDGVKRYALLINKNQLDRHEKRVLTPIGGGIAATSIGLEYLRSIGAVHFEKGDDLRFQLPVSSVEQFMKWFTKRVDRECSPIRELEEELVDETGILTMDDLIGMKIRFSGYGVNRGLSTHYSETNPIETLRLAELFTVKLSKAAMVKLEASAQEWVYFASREEIQAGVTQDGVEIADVCKTILTPQRDIVLS